MFKTNYLAYISLLLLFTYVVSMIYLYTSQDKLLFPGAYALKNETQNNATLNENSTPVEFTTSDNTTLQGVFVNNNKDSLVIYYGGNAENVKVFINDLSHFQSHDYISFNYRGFGYSQGSPSEEKIYSDALEIYDHFSKKYKKIYIIGRSLGTAPAVYVTNKRNATSLALITPYDSIVNVAQGKYPIFPIRLLLNHPFNAIQNITSIESPISILMVENDKVVPNIHTKTLKKHVKNLNQFTIVDNVTHDHVISDPRTFQFLHKSL